MSAPELKVIEAGQWLVEAKKLRAEGFDMLLAHTAIDRISENRFELIYQILSVNSQLEVGISISIPRDQPVIDSVGSVWPIAEFQEREVYDLFGVLYRNHADLRRILLDDDWNGFPLRKDYVDSFILTKPQVEKLSK